MILKKTLNFIFTFPQVRKLREKNTPFQLKYSFISCLYRGIPCSIIDCLRVAMVLILIFFSSHYFSQKKKKSNTKDAVRLQRSDLENFLKTGLIQKSISSRF